MKVKDLFSVEYPSTLIYSEMLKDLAEINFVSSQGDNNGVVSKVGILPGIKIYPAGVITVPLKGTVLAAHVQPEQCYVAHQVAVLSPLKSMSLQEKLFYCTCIKHNAYRFSYGRQADRTLEDLELPDHIPQWAENLSILPIKTGIKNTSLELNTEQWKEFKFEELFEISRGESVYLIDCENGNIPYASASSKNNGISAYIDRKNRSGNCIVVNYDGSIGDAFYQPNDFFASEKVATLTLKNHMLNKYIAMFIITIIKNEKFRFSYGSKWTVNGRMPNSIIKLPAKNDGTPDYEYMESFIKSLPYSDCI